MDVVHEPCCFDQAEGRGQNGYVIVDHGGLFAGNEDGGANRSVRKRVQSTICAWMSMAIEASRDEKVLAYIADQTARIMDDLDRSSQLERSLRLFVAAVKDVHSCIAATCLRSMEEDER